MAINFVRANANRQFEWRAFHFPGFTEKNYSLPNRSISKEYYTIQYGDVNEDGRISSSDRRAIYNHTNNNKLLTGQQLLNADVNGDGKINDTDSEILYQYLSGNISCILPSTTPCKG